MVVAAGMAAWAVAATTEVAVVLAAGAAAAAKEEAEALALPCAKFATGTCLPCLHLRR
jgi:hypothetical protein